jgi:hypothetical protein
MYQNITIIIFIAHFALKFQWASHCMILIYNMCYSEHLRIQAVLIIDGERKNFFPYREVTDVST